MRITEERRRNTVFGTLLLVMAMTFVGVSAYIVVHPKPAPTFDAINNAVGLPVTECFAISKGMRISGLSINENAKQISIRQSGENALKNAKDTIAKASVLMSVCKYELTNMCVGEGCKTGKDIPGVNISFGEKRPS